MSYRIDPKASVQKELRRIALEEMDIAISEALDPSLDDQSAVHQARKRCKGIRALLALCRGTLPSRAAENKSFRTLGHDLGPLRDADALLEAFAGLESADDGAVGAGPQAVLEALTLHRAAVAESEAGPDVLRPLVVTRMREACLRVPTWTLRREGWAAMEVGFRREYRRARAALEFFGVNASRERVHDLRKAVKRHWRHTRLMKRAWAERFSMRESSLDVLGELLGDDHDLGGLLKISPHLKLPRAVVGRLESTIVARQVDLREETGKLANELFADDTAAFVMEVGRRWETCRE